MSATGVILAGGRSRRMGENKLWLEVGGAPLWSRVYEALAPSCDEVLAVGVAEELAGVESPALRLVEDRRAGREGPLAGIEAGLEAARYPLVYVAAGDLPFLPPDLVRFSLELIAEKEAPAAVPLYRGRVHPLCAVYRRELLPVVSRALDEGTRAARALLAGLDGVAYIEEALGWFGEPEIFLMNVNSPEDLAKARAAGSFP